MEKRWIKSSGMIPMVKCCFTPQKNELQGASTVTCPQASHKLHNITEEFGRNLETRLGGGGGEGGKNG